MGFSTWSKRSEIHPTSIIGQNVVIENGCVIGEKTVIEHNVVLHAGTRIGKNSRIRSCSSIGGDGFGFERLADGTPLRFPHLGGVFIGDNVEVGSCTTIARGTLSDTVIEDNVKIDNLVHVAHNCVIRDGAFIIACAELSGGVTVGKNAWIAPNSCTHQKITIGENSLVGLGAVVTKDVPDRCVYAGNPAKKIRSLI
jgi:UDP-3-O-[3-hydroxymyristoyl] glucosamine N-acyltransferase